MATVPYLGSRIVLISKSEIRARRHSNALRRAAPPLPAPHASPRGEPLRLPAHLEARTPDA